MDQEKGEKNVTAVTSQEENKPLTCDDDISISTPMLPPGQDGILKVSTCTGEIQWLFWFSWVVVL